jgi:hypothetical protein
VGRILAKSLFVLAALALALPTVISFGPVTQLIVSAADSSLPGTLRLKDLSVGWFTGLRIDGLSLEEPDGGVVVGIERVRVERSLGGMILQGDRLGKVSIEGINADLARRSDGTINLIELLPPSSPKAPLAEDVGPLIPSFADLVPSIAIPTSKLHLELTNSRVAFHNELTSMGLTLAGLQTNLDWPGGAAPLTGRVQGTLRDGERETPIYLDILVEKWTDGKRLNGSDLRVALQGSLAEAPSADAASNSVALLARIEGERLDVDVMLSTLISNQLPMVPAESPVVASEGSIHLSLINEGQLASIRLKGELDAFRVEDESFAFAAEPVQIAVGVQLDRHSLEPEEGLLAVRSRAMRQDFSLARTSDGTTQTLEGGGTLSLTALQDGLSGPMVRSLPQVDASAEWSVQAKSIPGGQYEIRTHAAFRPRTLRFPQMEFLPDVLCPTSNTLDLSALALDLRSTVQLTPDSTRVRLEYVGPGQAVETTLSGIDGHWVPTTRGDFDLKTVSDWFAASFAMNPPIEVDGQVGLLHTATFDGGKLAQSLHLDSPGLAIGTPLLPAGEWTDQPMLSIEATTDTNAPVLGAGSDFDTTLGVRLESRFLESRLEMATEQRLVRTLDNETTLSLGALVADQLPSLAEAIAGSISTKVIAEQPSTDQVKIDFYLTSSNDLRVAPKTLTTPLPLIVLESEQRIDWADSPLLELDRFSLSVGNLFRATANGKAGMEVTDLTWLSVLDFPSLLALVEPALRGASAEGSISGAHALSGTITGTGLDRFSATVESALHMPELLLAAPGNALQLSDLADTRTLTIDYSPAEPLPSWKESGSSRLAALDWNGLAMLSELNVSTEGAGSSDGSFTWSAPNVTLVDALYTIDPEVGTTIALPTSNAEIHTSGTLVGAQRAAFRVQNEGVSADAHLLHERGVVTVDGVAEADLATLRNWGLKDVLQDFLKDFSGSVQGRFTATAPLEDPLAVEGTMSASAKDLFVDNYGSTARVASAAIELSGNRQQVSVLGDARLQQVALAEVPFDYLQDTTFNFFGDYRAERGGGLSLGNAMISIPLLGTELGARGEIGDVDAGVLGFVSPDSGSMIDQVLAFNVLLFGDLRQPMENVELAVPLLKGEGIVTAGVRLTNLPGQQLSFESDADLQGVALQYGDLLTIDAVGGLFQYRKRLFADATLRDRRPALKSVLRAGSVVVEYAPYLLRAEALLMSLSVGNQLLQGRFGSSAFCGGTFDSNFRLNRVGRDPVLEGEFALTGLDGATIFPLLAKRSRAERGLDGFGNLRLRLRENPTLDGIMDDLVLRANFSRIGRDLLREALRTMDPQGTNAGIQSTATALMISSPVDATVDWRGGLLTAAVQMRAPGGATFMAPLFDRANTANLFQTYLSDAYNPQLALLRLGLSFLLAEDLQSLIGLLQEPSP